MTELSVDRSHERKFLHDLGSPLAAAVFLTDIVLSSMQCRKDCDPQELKQMEEIHQALEKMTKLIEIQRDKLIKEGVPSARV